MTEADSLRRLIRRYRPVRRTAKFAVPPQPFPGLLNAVVAYNEHGGYCVPLAASHRIAAQQVLHGEVYEAETIRLIASECGRGDVVHAGTFFGDFLPAIARAASGMVWAFEPNPESRRCAAATVLLNDLENVRLIHAALGQRSGWAQLSTADERGLPRGGSSCVAEGGDTRVPMKTIDEVVPADRRVSVLQLDVEGFERQALEGALLTIERCRPLLVLETMPDAEWVERRLAPLGYRAAEPVPPNSVLRAR